MVTGFVLSDSNDPKINISLSITPVEDEKIPTVLPARQTKNANGTYPINRETERTNRGLFIETIELTDNATVVQMRFFNTGADLRHVRIYPVGSRHAFRLWSHDDVESFTLLSVVGADTGTDLAVAPGASLSFKLRFDRIPSTMVRFHLKEGDGTPANRDWRAGVSRIRDGRGYFSQVLTMGGA